MNTPTHADLCNDIPLDTARAAHNGTSHVPHERGDQERDGYARTLLADWQNLMRHVDAAPADQHMARCAQLDEEFERYRAGYRERYLARLGAMARCVSTMIAGRSNFNVRRANKASDRAEARTTDLIQYRATALAAIQRTLRPELAPIMSGDADAPERLRSKIAAEEIVHAQMKAANAAIRAHATGGSKTLQGIGPQISALVALGFSEDAARDLLTPDPMGRIGFPAYAISNHGAEIRRLKERLEAIEAARTAEIDVWQGTLARYEDNPAANRVRLYYPGKPDDATRTRLKSAGFRWAPSIGAWQGYRNAKAIDTAKREAGAPAGAVCGCVQTIAHAPEACEADPAIYACPDGEGCDNPECIAENTRRAEERYDGPPDGEAWSGGFADNH